jgi:ribosomal protein S18 acetylase RimI-like enzyme
MPVEAPDITIRPLEDVDIDAITRIDEQLTGTYRPDFWESRVAYYLRRDPESSRVALAGGKVVGFMLGDLRGGEFGLEETSGWIERFGVDPAQRGKGVGRKLFEALRGHFQAAGARTLRTFVDNRQAENASFLKAVGFEPGNLTALEMRVE